MPINQKITNISNRKILIISEFSKQQIDRKDNQLSDLSICLINWVLSWT